jgi:DNA-binding NarL/FixJ family response regulator
MIAEDHPVMLVGLATMLDEIDNFKIIGLAENGKKLIELIKNNEPQVAIVDLEMPVLDGFITIERLTKEFPKVKTVVFSCHNEKSIINEVIKLGARGYLTKDVEFKKIVETINQIHNDGYYFEREISKMVIGNCFKQKINQLHIASIGFTNRELEILELVCKEETNSKIADKLNISISTVDFHRRNILKKTKLSSAIGLVKFAIKSGIYNGN